MRVLLAGAQAEGHWTDLLHVGQYTDKPLQVLMSYYYFRKKSPEKTRSMLEQMKALNAWCMLDSGAHTYFAVTGNLNKEMFKGKAEKGTKQTATPPAQYMREYITWLKEFGHYFACFVELDIGAVQGVGMDKVYQWREDMLVENQTPVPVYHKSIEYNTIKTRGMFGGAWPAGERTRLQARRHVWEEWCKDDRYPYLGLAGGWQAGEYLEMLRISDKYGKKVHGFAMTNKAVFKDLTFYSVDSTSWLAGQQYGVTYVVDGNELKGYDKAQKLVRKKYRDLCDKYHIDYDKLLKDDPYEVNRFNAASWCEYQKIIDWQHRNDPIVRITGEGGSPPQPVTTKQLGDETSAAPEEGTENTEGTAVAMSEETLGNAMAPKEIRDLDSGAAIGRICATCYIADKCPFFKDGATCTVPFAASKGASDVTATPTMAEMLRAVMASAFERLQFAITYEKLRGGLIDPQVTKDIASFVRLARQIKEIVEPTSSVRLDVKGPEAPGILSRLFGGYGRQGGPSPSSRVEDSDVMDADFEENK